MTRSGSLCWTVCSRPVTDSAVTIWLRTTQKGSIPHPLLPLVARRSALLVIRGPVCTELSTKASIDFFQREFMGQYKLVNKVQLRE